MLSGSFGGLRVYFETGVSYELLTENRIYIESMVKLSESEIACNDDDGNIQIWNFVNSECFLALYISAFI